MDFAVAMIADINAFHSYYTGNHKRADYSHDGLELALSSPNPEVKKKTTWHFPSNYCNGASLRSLQYTLQCCKNSCTLYDISSFVKQLSEARLALQR